MKGRLKMTAFTFLANYISDNAIVTIVNNKGSIRYTGELGSMPYSVVKGMEFEKIDGLGSENDLFITVR
jgi:hypothetical protein